MIDKASQWLLNNALSQSSQPGGAPRTSTLWIVDENMNVNNIAAPAVGSQQNIIAISNRFDVTQQLQLQVKNSEFCDYNFSIYKAASFDHIVYRISKEKAVVHHTFNHAARLLKPGGIFWLSGEKEEGAKTFLSKLTKSGLFLGKTEKQSGFYSGQLERTATTFSDDYFDDQQYKEPRIIGTIGDHPIHSKPGLFGWKKIDRGSELLIQNLPDTLLANAQSILDLGCGYGYLSLAAATHRKTLTDKQAQWVLTDNNAAAVAMATINCRQHCMLAEVVADNCAQSINQRFDLVLCNPPFHKGFDTSADLTEQFLQSAQRHLRKNGTALFVVNQFIPITKKSTPYFSECTPLASESGFTIYQLR